MSTHFEPPIHPGRPGLVAPVRIDSSGRTGPTRHQAYGPCWRRTSQGLFVPAHVERTTDQRILEASTVVPVGRGAITGWAALRWQGGRWFEDKLDGGTAEAPVQIATSGHRLRNQPGLLRCEERFDPGDVRVVDGVAVMNPVASCVFAMRYAHDLWQAVRHLCMAAYDDLVSLTEAAEFAGRAPREGLSSYTGVPLCRSALALGHENVWSPQEVTMMLIWILEAGLPPPLMNQPIFDLDGRFLGTPDLFDLETGAAGEYHGAMHLVGGQPSRDRDRDEMFRDHGLEPFVMRAGDSLDRVGVAQRMRAARARARRIPVAARRWTVEPPSWWVSTTTVAERRALTDHQKARFLGYRVA